jgi:hypothetical protein
MTSHPSFEEITAVVFPTAVNSQYFQLAARVNAHLCSCADCKQVYNTLFLARQQAEELYFGETYRDA